MVESDIRVKCSLLFKLARRHGWGNPASKEDLVTEALKSSDQGKGKILVETLLDEPYIAYVPGKGYYVKNDPDSQAQAACRVTETCGYTDMQAESTFSRFEQAGGFDAYDKDDVLDTLDDW